MKKSLIFLGVFVFVSFAIFCIYSSVGLADDVPAETSDSFLIYEMKMVDDDVLGYKVKTFAPKGYFSGSSRKYYDFKDSKNNGGEAFVKRDFPYKNYISYDVSNPENETAEQRLDNSKTHYDFTQYDGLYHPGGSSAVNYMNYVGVNFSMKEFPYGDVDFEDITYVSAMKTYHIYKTELKQNEPISWHKTVWNNLQVNAGNEATASKFEIQFLGNLGDRNLGGTGIGYKRNKLYMLSAQSVFASQSTNTDYVYGGTAVLAYLMPVEPPADIIALTDGTTAANDGTMDNYQYLLDEDVIYCLTIQPMMWQVIGGINKYDIECLLYSIQGTTPVLINDYSGIQIVKVETFMPSQGMTWDDDIEWTTLPNSTCVGSGNRYQITTNGDYDRLYRIYFKYNFDALDAVTRADLLANPDFESHIKVIGIGETNDPDNPGNKLQHLEEFAIPMNILSERGII